MKEFFAQFWSWVKQNKILAVALFVSGFIVGFFGWAMLQAIVYLIRYS